MGKKGSNRKGIAQQPRKICLNPPGKQRGTIPREWKRESISPSKKSKTGQKIEVREKSRNNPQIKRSIELTTRLEC